MENKNEGYVFGLDIGTRSIVGTVGYRIGTDRFVVVAQESIEHTTRAVIDGQIHDISTVSKTITEIKNRLEKTIHQDLYEVSIAAAGRVLKTEKVQAEHEFPEETKVTAEHIRTLDMIGVEKAYEKIRQQEENSKRQFFCVGYSTIKYFLNGYPMEMIELHKANKIGVELIATFLPEEVVDGLYEAVEAVGLHVASLTLEPIAAINIAIPEKFRLLNIALVDVGAGTSDISIVKEGSIIAFGMIPLAGDEVTEEIARNYLIDFATAEKIKCQSDKKKTMNFDNIFGEHIRATREDVLNVAARAVDEITKNVADRIIELNGGKVSAVFVVGGGGKHEGFTQKLAEYLGLPENRVAIRGEEVLRHVDYLQEGIQKDSTLVTPIGICMNYYEKRNNFIHVTVNDQRVKLYDNGKVTVLDACVSAGYLQSNLFPVRGETLTYYVNGNERTVRGKAGEVAEVKRNGREVSLNEFVQENDEIRIRPSTKGESGTVALMDIPECREELTVTLFGKKVLCPKEIEVNGEEPEDMLYQIKSQDRIEVFDYYTVAKLLAFAEMPEEEEVLLNGVEAVVTAKVRNNDTILHKPQSQSIKKTKKKPEEEIFTEEPEEVEDFQTQMEKDPLLQPSKPLPEWMEGVPFDTAKMGADGQILPKTVKAVDENTGKPATTAPIHVMINGKPVTMPQKAKPIFVDVFDVYPFDLTKAGGTRLITRINGIDKDFTEPLWDGDEIELYWEK